MVGAGEATPEQVALAQEVGTLLAEQGHVVVCGGLGGVMEAAALGARVAGGVVVGLLPGLDRTAANAYVTVALPTGLGELRNGLVVRASDALISIGGDSLALGRNGRSDWTVSLPHPRKAGAMATLELKDGETAVTVGDYQRHFELDGKRYQPIIEAPYRWRDWAVREDGLTGDELLAFINQDECHRADGTRGAGLFAYLRALAGRGEKGSQREVIANVFRGAQNRMVSGYLLRDIINKINGIHFSSSEEIHTLSHLYESMLREMRDAAGDSGEFYTPRPVVRFMVQMTDPRLGETMLDPACGTGGFLVEAYDHLAAQVATTEQRRTLQRETLYGQEAKPLPYMLAQMNLLLHGLEAPQIAYGNTLERRINEIGHSERVDVILTNPPFGGEEEVGIKANFPPNMQTAETALLFLQYIMRKLRVAGAPVPGGKPAARGGRAAVVVPNGTLFGDGVCARIKEELVTQFNLHTIVRLPNVVQIQRPAFGQPNSTVTLFKLEPDGIHASAAKVTLGRDSVTSIQVLEGLRVGDKVIVSDTSQWSDKGDRIKLN